MVGTVGEVHPNKQKKLGIETRVSVAEININRLLECKSSLDSYSQVSLYPPVMRDVAFVVDSTTEHLSVAQAIESVHNLIVEVELFDVFAGKPSAVAAAGTIPDGKKSMAYHIVYQSKEKTLDASEADKIHAQVEKVLVKNFGAEVRR